MPLHSTHTAFTYIHEGGQRPLFHAYLFGAFRVFTQSQPHSELIWRRSKAKSLLKWFILNPGRVFSADQLVDLFWPDATSETSHRSLHVTVHSLRYALEPGLPRGQESTFIRRNANNFYSFHLNETWWIDVVEVQHLLEEVKRLDPVSDGERIAFYYRKILRHCEQDFLPEEAYEECFQPYRRQYQRVHFQALSHLMTLSVERREYDEALDYAYRALLLDHYYEPAVRAIVSVHVSQGDRLGAIRKLDEFQGVLEEELRTKPSRDFCALRETLANGLAR